MLASRLLQLDSIQIQREKKWPIRSVLQSRSFTEWRVGDSNPGSNSHVWECPWARHEPEQQRVRVSVHHEGAAKLYSSAVHVPFNIHLLLQFPQNHIGCLKAPHFKQTVGKQITGGSNNSLGPRLEAANLTWRWSIMSCRCSRCVDDAEPGVRFQSERRRGKIIQDLL